MSPSTKKVLLLIAAVIVGWWALGFVVNLALALIFKVIIPVLVIGGIGYGLYSLFGRKALGGGSRKTLP